MAFDSRRYHEKYIKRHDSRRGLPDDLVERYAITLPASDAEITAQVRAVRTLWNGFKPGARGADIVKLCRSGDEALRAEHGERMLTARWWADVAAHPPARAGRAQPSVFGINLGATHSAVAYIDDVGKPVVVRNSYGDDATPSVVFFENESSVVVGTVAKETAIMPPDSVVSLIRHEMGNTDYRRTFFGRDYTAPAISALILQALARDAETDTRRKLERAVITVPAYFSPLEKAATRQAGEIAGIEVIGIIPEPVAAALAYGLGLSEVPKTVLVYDLGGSSCDVTIMRMSADEIRSLDDAGDLSLGGADWDAALAEHFLHETIKQVGNDSILDDDSAMQEIANLAEKTKRRLSAAESGPAIIRYSSGSAKVTVTRAQFEQMTADLLEQTVVVTHRALDAAEEWYPGSTSRLSEVLLAGGSTWMPAVAARLKQEFGWDAKLADPDLATTKGAALYASHAFGRLVDDRGPRAVVPRRPSTPRSVRGSACPVPGRCVPLLEASVELPEPGPVEISFDVDLDEHATVRVREPGTGKSVTATVRAHTLDGLDRVRIKVVVTAFATALRTVST